MNPEHSKYQPDPHAETKPEGLTPEQEQQAREWEVVIKRSMEEAAMHDKLDFMFRRDEFTKKITREHPALWQHVRMYHVLADSTLNPEILITAFDFPGKHSVVKFLEKHLPKNLGEEKVKETSV